MFKRKNSFTNLRKESQKCKNDRHIRKWRFIGVQEFPENHVNDKREYYRKEYLKSEYWKDLKAKKFEQVNQCEKCGEQHLLDVHHLNYKNLYDVELCDLQVLCRFCHKRIHEIIDAENKSNPKTKYAPKNKEIPWISFKDFKKMSVEEILKN